MKLSQKIRKGLELLEAYGADGITAEHDQIWAVGDYHAAQVSTEDAGELKGMGWFIDDEAWSRFV